MNVLAILNLQIKARLVKFGKYPREAPPPLHENGLATPCEAVTGSRVEYGSKQVGGASHSGCHLPASHTFDKGNLAPHPATWSGTSLSEAMLVVDIA